jgi:hypothetical protein
MRIGNTNKFLDIVWPVILEWASIHGYLLPNEDYLNSYTVKKVDYIACTEPNTLRLGQHDKVNRRITLAFSSRSKQQKMLTLIHEYAHAIQCYNLRKDFDVQYSVETETYGYHENKFEVEARFMSALLELEFENLQSKIAKQLKKFNWLFTGKERCETWLEPRLRYKTANDWGQKYFGKFLD